MNTPMVSALLIAILGSQQFSPLGPAEQLYSQNAIQAMRTLRRDQQATIWPSGAGVIIVPSDRLPAALVAAANDWLERIVASDYLPGRTSRHCVGIRADLFPDTIALRYRLADGDRMQILEEDVRVLVTIDRPAAALSGNQTDDVLQTKDIASRFLRIPDGALSRAVVKAGTTTTANGCRFLVGTIQIDTAGKSVEWLAWWNRIWFQATESTYTFTFHKSLGDGKPGTSNGSNGRRPPPGRFGDIG